MLAANPIRRLMEWLNYSDGEVGEEPIVNTASAPPKNTTPPKRHQNDHLKMNPNQKSLVIRHPRKIEDCEEIIDAIKLGNMVTVDLSFFSEKEIEIFQAIFHGSLYSLDASSEQVSEKIYVFIPVGCSVISDSEYVEEPRYSRKQSTSDGIRQEKFTY